MRTDRADTRIASASVAGISARGRTGQAGKTMSKVAVRVVATLSHELNLAVDPDGRRTPFAPGTDLYGIEAEAEALVRTFGGNVTSVAAVARALHAFSQQVSSLMAARADSGAVKIIEQAILKAQSARSADSVEGAILMIQAATDSILDYSPTGTKPATR